MSKQYPPWRSHSRFLRSMTPKALPRTQTSSSEHPNGQFSLPTRWMSDTAFGVLVAVSTLVGLPCTGVPPWAGERGCIYKKHNRRPRLGGTLGLLRQIYQPSIEHVIDEQSSEGIRGEQVESGDKPEAGFAATDV